MISLLPWNGFIVAEERQDQNAKRRKIEEQRSEIVEVNAGPTTSSTSDDAGLQTSSHALPARPTFDSFEGAANAAGFGAKETTDETTSSALAGFAGSAADWVRNRSAIRMANLSAADMLRADMMSARPVKQKPEKRSSFSPQKPMPALPSSIPTSVPDPAPAPAPTPAPAPVHAAPDATHVMDEAPGPEKVPVASEQSVTPILPEPENPVTPIESDILPDAPQTAMETEEPVVVSLAPSEEADDSIAVDSEIVVVDESDESPHGVKRKIDEVIEVGDDDADGDADAEGDDDDEASSDLALKYARVVNADGSVDQEDTVKLVNLLLLRIW